MEMAQWEREDTKRCTWNSKDEEDDEEEESSVYVCVSTFNLQVTQTLEVSELSEAMKDEGKKKMEVQVATVSLHR